MLHEYRRLVPSAGRSPTATRFLERDGVVNDEADLVGPHARAAAAVAPCTARVDANQRQRTEQPIANLELGNHNGGRRRLCSLSGCGRQFSKSALCSSPTVPPSTRSSAPRRCPVAYRHAVALGGRVPDEAYAGFDGDEVGQLLNNVSTASTRSASS